MGWRIRRSKKIGPVRVTASKSGLSYSVGVPGARYTVRADGNQQVTMGIPSSGISYTQTVGNKTKSNAMPRGSVYTSIETVSQQLQRVRQEKESVQKGMHGYLVGLLFASPILLILAFIPGLNALLGVLLSIPLFSASQKLGPLEDEERRLDQLLEQLEYEHYNALDDEQDAGRYESETQSAPPLPLIPAKAQREDLTVAINDAERKLAKATGMFGEDHPKVADCLDELAALLRTAKIRTLDAANMEARARVIRTSNS